MNKEYYANFSMSELADTRARYAAVLSKPPYAGPKRVYKKKGFLSRILRAVGLA